jgi:hypothetical protein
MLIPLLLVTDEDTLLYRRAQGCPGQPAFFGTPRVHECLLRGLPDSDCYWNKGRSERMGRKHPEDGTGLRPVLYYVFYGSEIFGAAVIEKRRYKGTGTHRAKARRGIKDRSHECIGPEDLREI